MLSGVIVASRIVVELVLKPVTYIRPVVVVVSLVLFTAWYFGAFTRAPSLQAQHAFAAMLRTAPSDSFTTKATLEKVELVHKHMNPMPGNPLRWLFQQTTYEYAARYRFSGTKARFIVLLPVDLRPEDLSFYDPDVKEPLLSVANAYSEVTSAPLVSSLDNDSEPNGDTVWQLYEFDPKAVDDYLAGKGYRFLRKASGSVTLIKSAHRQ